MAESITVKNCNIDILWSILSQSYYKNSIIGCSINVRSAKRLYFQINIFQITRRVIPKLMNLDFKMA